MIIGRLGRRHRRFDRFGPGLHASDPETPGDADWSSVCASVLDRSARADDRPDFIRVSTRSSQNKLYNPQTIW
jgi:hypothetical protein